MFLWLARHRRLVFLASFLLAVYSGCYGLLSRRGAAWCEPYNMCGFLYVLPTDTPHWYRLHLSAYVLFYPINQLDQMAGTGTYPVRSITFGLSGNPDE